MHFYRRSVSWDARFFANCRLSAALSAIAPLSLSMTLWFAAQAAHCAEPAATVSLTSLLREMTDRDSVAKWPSPEFGLKESSSHDRRKINPADPGGWHSNDDHDQFIRTEVNSGRPEWVIMDHDGPGAITRFWIPLLADKDKQLIRFYFDGSDKPAITANFNELMSGKLFVRPPLAFVAWNETDLRKELASTYKAERGVAGDLYLPIPFAKSCKITLDQVPFYYVINYRAYAPGTKVETFTMSAYWAAKEAITRTNAAAHGRAPEVACSGAAENTQLTLLR